MKSDLAKVLHPVAGRPLLLWVLDAVAATEPDEVVVVVGHQAEAVEAILPHQVSSALQAEQLGTGHAAAVGLAALQVQPDDVVIVMPGDMPLIKGETLRRLLRHHRTTGSAATLLSVELDDPGSYGRVIRKEGKVTGIVEVRDASADELAVRGVNTSVYAFSGRHLPQALDQIGTNNAQGEYYLTDVVGILVSAGLPVAAILTDAVEGLGINSVDQIADVAAHLEGRTDGGPIAR